MSGKLLTGSDVAEYTCISYSQGRSYLTCRRKWQLERIYPRKYKDYFTIGSLVHAGVALYYNNIKNGTNYDVFEEMLTVAESIIHEHPSFESEILANLESAKAYVTNYINFASAKDFFKPVEIEQEYIVELSAEEKTACKIIIDGLVETAEGDLYLLEHKTPARIEEDHLALDAQITLYWALLENILDRPIKGVVYNMIRKKVPSTPKILQHGGLSAAAIDTTAEIYLEAVQKVYGDVENAPEAVQSRYAQLCMSNNEYVARRILTRSPEELSDVFDRFKVLASEIAFRKQTNVGIIPNPTTDCSRCDFAELCAECNRQKDLPTPEEYKKLLESRGEI